jgi:hypothetical protein
LSVRLIIAAAILWGVISIPLPLNDEELILMLRVPIAVFLFIVFTGKTLYDTFFYERGP